MIGILIKVFNRASAAQFMYLRSWLLGIGMLKPILKGY